MCHSNADLDKTMVFMIKVFEKVLSQLDCRLKETSCNKSKLFLFASVQHKLKSYDYIYNDFQPKPKSF